MAIEHWRLRGSRRHSTVCTSIDRATVDYVPSCRRRMGVCSFRLTALWYDGIHRSLSVRERSACVASILIGPVTLFRPIRMLCTQALHSRTDGIHVYLTTNLYHTGCLSP